MRRVPVVLVLALLATLAAVPPASAVGDVSDTLNIQLPAGANDAARLALRLSRATFPDDGADRVLIATDAQFADALTSGTLQGDDTPLLLTPADDVRADVVTEINRLGATEVVLLGGVNALDETVEDELSDAGLDVERVAGPTRIETAIEVAELAPESSTAIVSRAFPSGEDASQAFADSLAAGAWAAATGWPSLLTSTDALPETIRQALADSDIERVMLLGGTAAVSPAVEEELESLGVDVVRVAGATRFDTAVEVAEQRGFDSAADAERIILVEGQAPDAWAAGFAAAAHSAAFDAPVLLANGPTLPPATEAFLRANTSADGFAVDVEEITEPVLVCAADPAACDLAREALGLPTEATLELDEPEDGVPSRSTLTGFLELFGADADVVVFGPCVTDGLVIVGDDGTFGLDVQASEGVCPLEFEIRFGNGTLQRISRTILVGPAEPLTGPVVDTETGGDAYTIVPADADAPVVVRYSAADDFVVDGEPATIGAFEASVTVADMATFRADNATGTVHELVNVDPDSITEGIVGNIDQSAGTMAIVEPVTGVALRPGIVLPAEAALVVDGDEVDQEAFDANINEGDQIALTATGATLTNRTVIGTVSQLDLDAVSGIIRLAVGGLGDDHANAEDDLYRLLESDEQARYTVDGSTADFDAAVAALSLGDTASYRRANGIVRLTVANRAVAPVEGLVTETYDPDGSPVAPEPSDGGELTVLTDLGRVALSYSADAVFRLDGAIATEAEFEAARTPGDAIVYQAPDAATETPESLSLETGDLIGDLADITEGDNTFDVVTLAGVVYDDLDYSAAIFGGESTFEADGTEITLREFEDLLGLIDDGEEQATVIVRPFGANTLHRLTFIDG